MHDTNTNYPLTQSTTLQADTSTLLPTASGKTTGTPKAAQSALRPVGLVARVLQFFFRLFKRDAIRANKLAALTLAERSAASRAAQMMPPVAFMGDTTNTLVTPMGAYAGKPVEQALRKRAEQQFKNMDITRATIN